MIAALAVVFAFLSALMVTTSVRLRRPDPVEERLGRVKAAVQYRGNPLDKPLIDRALAPAMTEFGKLIMNLLPPTWIVATSKRLVWAGDPLTTSAFVLIWVASAILVPLWLVFLASTAGASTVILIVLLVVGITVGGYGPQFWLSSRISHRQFLTRKQLPDALDLMTTSVEAGLSLDAALMRVTEYQTGPLQEELGRALQDMTLGQTRRDALTGVAERLNVPEFINFVQTLNQAEITGAPIGQILRVQAEQVRIARRQAAEAQAQRAPLLMLIPLVLFIFPSLFIVLMAPVALTIIDLLKNEGPF